MSKKTLKILKNRNGITLVALIVTIIIIIILSTVVINMAFGENGLIKQAELAKDLTTNSTEHETETTINIMSYINEILDEKENEEEIYIDNTIVEAPSIEDGMIPVKYEEGVGWVKTNIEDEEWYDYGKKLWANIVLEDASFDENNGKEVLNEEKPYCMLVWIPRFAYKITSGWHSSVAGTIEIVFIDREDKGKDGTKYEGVYNSENGAYSDYVVHPAFNYGDETIGGIQKLAGIWVGKFESSNTNCTQEVTTGEAEYSGEERMTIRANVTSWRNISAGDAFEISINMNKEGNIYGLESDDGKVDPHLMKNSEWGAVAYLSKSEYGKGEEEVYTNNNSNYITGIAGETPEATESTSVENSYKTEKGQKASTNGNLTGIYDMSGGAWDCVAAYVNNSYMQDEDSVPYVSAKQLMDSINEGQKRYADIYEQEGVDNSLNNYKTNSTRYGDAIYETAADDISNLKSAWFNDYSNYPNDSRPLFGRGARFNIPGIFSFNYSRGNAYYMNTFRVAISVM